ncbi:hypothetical protein BGW80DRAFT_1460284 [Lactifluus volemus]|nr:hypothetical protein BGW80DRAFT_1460284 [Lactifluus volemus]
MSIINSDLIMEFDTDDSPNDGAMEHSHPFLSQIHQANGYATRLPPPNTLQTPSSQTPQATDAKSILHYFRDSTSITFADPVLVNYFQHLALYHLSPDDFAGDPGHLLGGVGQRQSVPEPITHPSPKIAANNKELDAVNQSDNAGVATATSRPTGLHGEDTEMNDRSSNAAPLSRLALAALPCAQIVTPMPSTPADVSKLPAPDSLSSPSTP